MGDARIARRHARALQIAQKATSASGLGRRSGVDPLGEEPFGHDTTAQMSQPLRCPRVTPAGRSPANHAPFARLAVADPGPPSMERIACRHLQVAGEAASVPSGDGATTVEACAAVGALDALGAEARRRRPGAHPCAGSDRAFESGGRRPCQPHPPRRASRTSAKRRALPGACAKNSEGSASSSSSRQGAPCASRIRSTRA